MPRKKFDLINVPQDPRLFQELIEAVAERSVDPVFTCVQQLPFKRNVLLRTPSKPDGTSTCSLGSKARSSRAVAMLQIEYVFNARPTEAYSRNASSLTSLLAEDAQTAFYHETGTVKPTAAALRPKVRTFDYSSRYGLIFLR